jgi:gas vesicle protein
MRAMRRVLVTVLAMSFLVGVPSAALAQDGQTTTTPVQKEEGVAELRKLVEEFRADLAALKNECLSPTTGVADERKAWASDCHMQLKTLRKQFKELVRATHERIAEEKKRVKEEQAAKERAALEAKKRQELEEKRRREQLALQEKQRKEALARQEALRKEQAKQLALQTTLKELDAKIAYKRAEMLKYQQCAREQRALAETLEGEAQLAALVKAEKCEALAAEYAEYVRKLEAQRAALLAGTTTSTTSPTTLEKLQLQLKELDSTIAYKRERLAAAQQCAREYRALAETLTGEAREYKLAKAAACEADAAYWAEYVQKLEAQRAELVAKIAMTA